jgi:hypothetical protein
VTATTIPSFGPHHLHSSMSNPMSSLIPRDLSLFLFLPLPLHPMSRRRVESISPTHHPSLCYHTHNTMHALVFTASSDMTFTAIQSSLSFSLYSHSLTHSLTHSYIPALSPSHPLTQT